jgi:hypothetical protein
VHLLENSKLTAAGITLSQVCRKILAVGFTRFAIKISDQVFGSMTDRPFVNVWHFNYLGFAINY